MPVDIISGQASDGFLSNFMAGKFYEKEEGGEIFLFRHRSMFMYISSCASRSSSTPTSLYRRIPVAYS